jgi:hypothetical protein
MRGRAIQGRTCFGGFAMAELPRLDCDLLGPVRLSALLLRCFGGLFDAVLVRVRPGKPNTSRPLGRPDQRRTPEGILWARRGVFRANCCACGHRGPFGRDFLRGVFANDSGSGKLTGGDSGPRDSALHRCRVAWDLRDSAHVRVGRRGYAAQSACGSHDERGLRDSGHHRSQVRADPALHVYREIMD